VCWLCEREKRKVIDDEDQQRTKDGEETTERGMHFRKCRLNSRARNESGVKNNKIGTQ
jgi:hypothetical protein